MLKPMNSRQRSWTQHQWIRLIAGSIVLISLTLALSNPAWLWLTAFVGLNLLQSAFTNWCPLIVLLQKQGVRG
jgi:apolipoprotein N-acyltransferase